MLTEKNLRTFHKNIFLWWKVNGRVLPWREKISSPATKIKTKMLSVREEAFTTYFAGSPNVQQRDPYRVVVSEMMLQQTQVDRVLPKYEAWIKKWPTINDLANAKLSDIMILWQGLGYNRRARFLWLLAKEITEKYHGRWPQTEKELRALPGIGPYTARAILVFAFHQQIAMVDTNIKRILERVCAISEKEADEIIPIHQADPWGQALMDFGALICTAKNPKCDGCPVHKICQANISAQKNNFSHFATFLKTRVPAKKRGRAVRFEDTDRFFRGRIIDELRQKNLTKNQLARIMAEKYGLFAADRFEKLLHVLAKENLLVLRKSTISLE